MKKSAMQAHAELGAGRNRIATLVIIAMNEAMSRVDVAR